MNISHIIKRLLAVFATAVLGLAAPVLLMKSARFDAEICQAGWFAALPFVLMAVSAALAVCFRQTRVAVLALVWLGISLRGVQHFGGGLPQWALGDFVLVATVLLPCLSLCLFLMQERRVLSARGIVRFYLALVVVGILYWLPGVSAFHERVLSLPTWLAGTYAPEKLNIAPIVWLGLLMVGGVMFAVERPESPSMGRMFTALMVVGMAALNAPMTCWPDVGQVAVFRCLCLSAGLLLVWTVLDGAWRHAYDDELTRLPGRRPMRHHFASLGSDYALAVIDIDHFKRVNDSYGHDVGDQVLRFVAGEIRAIRGGTAYRFGGEEFVVVFGRRYAEQSEEILNGLLERIADRPFALRDIARPERKPKKSSGAKKKAGGDKVLKVTVSAGVAWPTDDEPYPDEVLGLADKALYKAKKGGRNRVCAA